MRRRTEVGAALAANVARAAVSFIAAVFVARALGPAERGNLEIIRLYPLMFASLGSLSVQQAVRYMIARNPSSQSRIAASALAAALMLGVVEALVLVLAIPFLAPPESTNLVLPMQIFCLFIPISFVGACGLALNLAPEKRTRWLVLVFLEDVLRATFMAGVVLASVPRATSVAVAHLSGTALWALLCWQGVSCELRRIRRTFRVLAYRGLRFTIPTLAQSAYLWVYRALPVWLLEPRQLGLFAVASTFANQTSLLRMPFQMLGFMEVASARSIEEARSLVCTYSRFSTLIAAIAAPLVGIAGAGLFWVALGPEFDAGVALVALLAIGSAGRDVFSNLGAAMRAYGGVRDESMVAVALLLPTAAAIILGRQLGGVWGISVLGSVAAILGTLALLRVTSLRLGVAVADLSVPTKGELKAIWSAVGSRLVSCRGGSRLNSAGKGSRKGNDGINRGG